MLMAMLGAGLAAAGFPLTLALAAEAVDVELVLAVDVSLSMSPMELDIQGRGYVEALTHDNVIEAIESGLHGRIAVTYFEWAGESTQRVVVPWTVIATRADAAAFAQALSVSPPASARRTSVSSALSFAADLFAESGFQGMRRVIDISGDGPNNQGPPVTEVRDAVTAQNITINGLPLMTTDADSGGFVGAFDMANLDIYYKNCVIGGPGAFMVPVNDWSQFPEAIRRKLVLELAGTWPGSAKLPVILAQDQPYDCLVGEKQWGERRWNWGVP
jgi:hypothetical protein